jgi:hypothetical protein
VIDFFEMGEKLGTSRWTIEEAKRANLLKRDTWKSYPADLLFARALTRGIRRYCPDLLMGAAYTPEELGGEVVEIAAPPAGADKPTPEQLNQLRALKADLGIGADAWGKIIGKRGVATARDLTAAQADELVKALAHRANCKLLSDGLKQPAETATNPPAEGGEAAAEATKSESV